MAANLIPRIEEKKVAKVRTPSGKMLPPAALITKRKRTSSWNWNSLEAIELALREHKGYISRASRALGITPDAVRKRIRENASLKKVLEEIREEDLDEVESILDKQVRDGNMTAIIWTLKCRGRHRGWNERPEEAPIPVAEPNRDPVLIINFVTPQDNLTRKPNESAPIAGRLTEG